MTTIKILSNERSGARRRFQNHQNRGANCFIEQSGSAMIDRIDPIYLPHRRRRSASATFHLLVSGASSHDQP